MSESLRERLPSLVSQQNYIDGEWSNTETNETVVSRNPAVPDEAVAEFPKSNRDEAARAVAAAVAAQEEWRALSAHERGDYVREAAHQLADQRDELGKVMTREMGKRLDQACGEVQRAIDVFEYYAELVRDVGGVTRPSQDPDVFAYTRREPWGTAALITPWNFPIAIPAWKLAPALVTGNTVVFKPASQTAAIASALVGALADAGVPNGVVNFVTGSGSTVGDEFVTSDGTDLVSFTGSYTVGSDIYKQATDMGKRVQCEMGGKNPLVVDEYADLDLAVDLTVEGAFSYAGQKCTATSRAIVVEDIYDEYLEALLTRIDDLTVGDPLDGDTDVGPKVSETQLEEDLEYVTVGHEEGATLVHGGERIDREGYFVEPTVFTEVDPDMRIAQEEIFGPILSVIEVPDFDAAVNVANGVEYGLVASLCTDSLHRAQEFARRSETGIVKINEPSTGVELQMPFGGRKHSGTETFKEQGRSAFDFFTHEKSVYLSHFER
jgi:2,5-dioxopentanoate dehydrogenase